MRKKKWMSGVLAIFIILTTNSAVLASTAPVFINTTPERQLRWDNTAAMIVNLSIKNGKAILSAGVDGYRGVTEITAEATLERKNSNGTYTELASWDDIIADGRYLSWSATRYVSHGYTYRLTINATVYKNGVGEDVSGSKNMYY